MISDLLSMAGKQSTKSLPPRVPKHHCGDISSTRKSMRQLLTLWEARPGQPSLLNQCPTYVLIVSFVLLLEVALLQIPRHARKFYYQPIKLFAHLDLASKPTSFCQAKCQIQHIVFIIVRLRQFIVVFWRLNNYVAGTACTGASAGAFHFHVAGLSNVQEIVSVGHNEFMRFGVLIEESYSSPSKEMSMR